MASSRLFEEKKGRAESARGPPSRSRHRHTISIGTAKKCRLLANAASTLRRHRPRNFTAADKFRRPSLEIGHLQVEFEAAVADSVLWSRGALGRGPSPPRAVIEQPHQETSSAVHHTRSTAEASCLVFPAQEVMFDARNRVVALDGLGDSRWYCVF